MLTTIVLPSRGRPSRVQMMIKSARAMAVGDLEIIVRLHDDDPAKEHYRREGAEFRDGPSAPTTWLWNELGMSAKGDVIMLAADDFEFMTKGWDALIRDGAPADNIWVANFVQAPGGNSFGNGYVLTRETRDALGYFTAYWFHHWASDWWMTETAKLVGRFRELKNVCVIHHKSDDDTRKSMSKIPWVYQRDQAIKTISAEWRRADSERLRAAINAGR